MHDQSCPNSFYPRDLDFVLMPLAWEIVGVYEHIFSERGKSVELRTLKQDQPNYSLNSEERL